jgi:hypothetical protein
MSGLFYNVGWVRRVRAVTRRSTCFGRIACGDVANGNDAAGRAEAGYLSLLVQRKVTQRKHAPEPPKPPALLAEGGARPTAHPCAAVGFALPARTALTRGLIRLRLRCSAAATGPDIKSNILIVCAARTLSVFDIQPRQSSPSTAARPGAVKRAPVRANRAVGAMRVAQRPASRGAQGTARLVRGERSGVLSFGYFSLHEQRKVTRPRRGSRIVAFQASPQAIQQEQVDRRVTALARLTHPTLFATPRGR